MGWISIIAFTAFECVKLEHKVIYKEAKRTARTEIPAMRFGYSEKE